MNKTDNTIIKIRDLVFQYRVNEFRLQILEITIQTEDNDRDE
jgi:hypothetical protein